MINDFVLKGIIANIWRYAVALFFRLAWYCHPDLPPKPLSEVQALADFVTIHLPQGPLSVWMHDFLHSQDYKESLADFVEDSNGTELLVLEKLDLPKLQAPRGTMGVVARRIMSEVNGSRW